MKTDNFHSRLTMARDYRKLTQVSLAKKSGIARQTYIDMETGKTIPRIDRVEALAKVLGFPVEWLAFGIGDGSTNKVEVIINGVPYGPKNIK